MYRIALLIEYDGTRYFGFQFQKNLPTVQGEIEKALFKLFGREVKLRGASRTDAGAHALGQVASFVPPSDIPEDKIKSALNHYLPPDIKIRACSKIPFDFDVRKAESRTYIYIVLNRETPSAIWGRFSYHVRNPLDIGIMKRAFSMMVGRRDFSPFTLPSYPFSRVREVKETGIKKKGDFIIFKMRARSFLPQQVRRTVGTLILLGLGKMNMDEFISILEGKGEAKFAPPARGLFLFGIKYKEEIFDEDGVSEN